MRSSTDHILTSHVGSLPRPDELIVANRARETGEALDEQTFQATLSGAVRLRYRFENLTDRPTASRLFVLFRPFQVTPPWQNFRRLGGVSEIHDLSWHEGAV